MNNLIVIESDSEEEEIIFVANNRADSEEEDTQRSTEDVQISAEDAQRPIEDATSSRVLMKNLLSSIRISLRVAQCVCCTLTLALVDYREDTFLIASAFSPRKN